jgi:hypothetical protein
MWHVWGRGKVHTGFWEGNLKGRAYLEDLVVDGKIILKSIFEKEDWGVVLIVLTQDRERWQAFLSTVMNFPVL